MNKLILNYKLFQTHPHCPKAKEKNQTLGSGEAQWGDFCERLTVSGKLQGGWSGEQEQDPGAQDDTWRGPLFSHPPLSLAIADPRRWFLAESMRQADLRILCTVRSRSRDLAGRESEWGIGHSAWSQHEEHS